MKGICYSSSCCCDCVFTMLIVCAVLTVCALFTLTLWSAGKDDDVGKGGTGEGDGGCTDERECCSFQ